MAWLPWNADQDRLRDDVMLQVQQLAAKTTARLERIAWA